jgi:hypothetical protein
MPAAEDLSQLLWCKVVLNNLLASKQESHSGIQVPGPQFCSYRAVTAELRTRHLSLARCSTFPR